MRHRSHPMRARFIFVASVAFAACAVAAVTTAPALAMPPAGQKLYEEGKAALKSGDLDRALARFREAMPVVAAVF